MKWSPEQATGTTRPSSPAGPVTPYMRPTVAVVVEGIVVLVLPLARVGAVRAAVASLTTRSPFKVRG
jgi:hypothetical protein